MWISSYCNSTHEDVIEESSCASNVVGGERGCSILVKACINLLMYNILVLDGDLLSIDLSIETSGHKLKCHFGVKYSIERICRSQL